MSHRRPQYAGGIWGGAGFVVLTLAACAGPKTVTNYSDAPTPDALWGTQEYMANRNAYVANTPASGTTPEEQASSRAAAAQEFDSQHAADPATGASTSETNLAPR